MKSVIDVYMIGIGPDTALNNVPYRSCKEINKLIEDTHQKVDHIEIDFYNEYSRFGLIALTKDDILAAFKDAKFPIEFKYDLPTPPAARSPYTFDVLIFSSKDEVAARHRVVSTYAGNYIITDLVKKPVYTFKTFDEMIKFFKDHKGMTYLDFCSLFDHKEDIEKHFKECLEIMDGLATRGLTKTGPLKLNVRDVYYERRAKHLADKINDKITNSEKTNNEISAYAYAMAEEVVEKCMTVFCPTSSTAAVVFAPLLWFRKHYPKVSEERIYNAMAGAALIASLAGEKAKLAASQVGCQGPMGTATGISAAILASLLYDADMEEMCRAYEMALEHCLGLICDSIHALPLIPCIQRSANFATRALEIAIMNHSLMPSEELCKLEDVLKVLNDTGTDLNLKHKRMCSGGLRDHATYSLLKNGGKK